MPNQAISKESRCSINSSSVLSDDDEEAEQALKDSANQNKCLNIKTNPRVTALNMTALFVSSFTAILIMTLETSFTTYLLKANFGITNGDEAAKVAGNLGFVGDIGSLSADLFMGAAMDIFGRKYISIGGLFIASVVMFCKPLVTTLSALYVLKVFTNIGALPLLYSPYPVDYI